MMRLLALATLVASASAHGSLFIPSPRNSQDNRLPSFSGGKSPATPCTVRRNSTARLFSNAGSWCVHLY